ncbi:hypothetical protein M427DRAFT_307558 [Gonapodya prolifera JEL478]|uniref:Uncharacterized protein n=1 Tax=Gonapodya prolifera (strain JEL478) TaxID=1344416 RepID=A0A139AHH6_GONPJ|nr:hypothetical protein M427DRAFT_307558 [Gonapodya prolifera JEL478]|eukprot:KXS16014.1 hypothetical protein M427DRAFT_307558 [Gonapodya prolifera JEL478]
MATESSSQKDLIRCIECEDIGGVADALARGANPNTRKKVVLTCKVSTGIFKSETRTDTIQAESALALAVRGGNLEIAELLLSAGVDPNWGVRLHLVPPPASML